MTDIRSGQVEANGLTFAIDEAGSGDQVALFLHGFPESRRSWRRQLDLLADLGWRAVAPDLRGYAKPSRPIGRAAYQIDKLIEDVGALFDALGARRRLLVGHDWGGLIAWAAASRRVRPLEGLVIMNAPHPAAYAALVRRSPAQMARSWYVLFFQLPWLPEALATAWNGRALERAFTDNGAAPDRFAAEDLEGYRQNALEPGAMTAMINYYRANVWNLGRADRTMSRVIETPTLVIWGKNDRFLGVELATNGAAFTADLTVRKLPSVSHWVQQEAPSEVNAAMAAWMREKGLAV